MNSDSLELIQRLTMLRAQLRCRYLGSDLHQAIDCLIVGFMIKGQVLIIGPPGGGKTELAIEIAKCFGSSWGYAQYSSDGRKEEIVGPVSLKALKEKDQYIRQTEGYLPSVDVFVGDEIGRGSTPQLEASLLVFSQRKFAQGGKLKDCPLRLFVGTSNSELPEGSRFDAVNDRFDLRLFFEDTVSGEDTDKLVDWSFDPTSRPAIGDEHKLSLAEVERLVSLPVTISEGQLARYKAFIGKVQDAVFLSNRKVVRLSSILKCHALLNGRTQITKADFDFLRHALWNRSAEMPKVDAVVSKTLASFPQLSVLEQELDNVVAIASTLRHPQVISIKQDRVRLIKQEIADLGLTGDLLKHITAKLEKAKQSLGLAIQKAQ